jgi:hypothetical protein
MKRRDKMMMMRSDNSKTLLMRREERVWLMKRKSKIYKQFWLIELNKPMKQMLN